MEHFIAQRFILINTFDEFNKDYLSELSENKNSPETKHFKLMDM